MKIALFADNFYPELSGIADTIATTGKELVRRGHHIEYFVPSYTQKDYERSATSRQEPDLGTNVRIHRMASLPFPTGTLQGRAAIPNILSGYSNTKFDIVHSNSFWGPGMEAFCLSKIQHIPLIGTNHTLIESFIDYSPIKNNFVKHLLKSYVVGYYNRCTLVTTPSDFLIEDMKNAGLQKPTQNVSNPIEPLFFTPRAPKENLKNELGLSSFTFLYTGRISAEKNVSIVLDAFIDFLKIHSDAQMVFIGHGTLRLEYEEKIKSLGLTTKIIFTGPFLGENKHLLYDYYHASDAFVMPSTSETQSMSTLQAMATQIPIIAANAGALPEIIKDRGVLFEPNDKNSLTTQLEYVYSKNQVLDKIVTNARKYAENYTVQTIADVWEKIYYTQIHHGKA